MTRTLVRVVLGALLLLWIVHVIFLSEAERWAEVQGIVWDSMARGAQWKLAWQEGPKALWGTLTLVSPAALALSVMLMGAILLLGVARWTLALRVQGLSLGGSRALEISFVAHFFNSFMLGSTGGDLMKAYYAARETHHRKTDTVVTVFVDRMIGLWAMLLFGAIMLLPNQALLAGNERFRTLVILILGMLGACTVMVYMAFYGGLTRRWAGARHWLRRLPKGEWLERSLNSCRRFGQTPGFVFKSMGISMGLNLLCVAQVYVLSRGLHQEVPAVALLAIVPMIICVSAIPITPSGLGVRENLFVLVLTEASLGVEATSALSLSLLAYAGSLFWSLVGGVVYMTLKDRHHLHDEELAAEADDPAT